MPAPPKPWERNSGGSSLPSGHPPTTGGGTCPAGGGSSITGAGAGTTAAAGVGASNPALPPRPSTMAAAGTAGGLAGTTTTGLAGSSGLGTYGSTGYGSTGYGGGYGSRYGGGYGGGLSRFGGYGGMMGGMGGYGMGGYGMGGYGMGGYGMGGYGMGGYGGMPGQMGPDGFSLTQRMEAGTQATFQILESVVGAFGGFAQMLESTFMATHSSFFAMVGVAEQFGHLRNYLGQVLSIFALLRWLKGLLFRLTGRDLPPELAHPWGAPGLDAAAFRAFEANGGAGTGPTPNGAPRPSRRPIIVFFMTVIGLPYLMNRLVRMITARQEEEARRRAEAGLPPLGPNGQPIGPDGMPLIGPDGQPLPQPPPSETAIDPSTLTFVRATHAFTSNEPQELTFQPNDIIAVLTPQAERQEPGWWRGRLRDGRIGWFPSTHVAEVPMKKAGKTIDDATPPNKDLPPKGGKGGGGGGTEERTTKVA